MRARLVLAGSAALVCAVGGIASATATPPAGSPVTITHNDGGTQVNTGIGGQPLVGVSSDSRGICYGFSYQVGHCVPVTFG